MSSLGQTLREAREARGLTCSQIAEQTHILPQMIIDIEKEDFHAIPAPIYGRGFVRLYAEAVGLDPIPLVGEFMAIINGHRPAHGNPVVSATPYSQAIPPKSVSATLMTSTPPTVAPVSPLAAESVTASPTEETAVAQSEPQVDKPDEIPPVNQILTVSPTPEPESAPEEPEPEVEPDPVKQPPVVDGLDLFAQIGDDTTPSSAVASASNGTLPVTSEAPTHESTRKDRPPMEDSPYLPSDFIDPPPSHIDQFKGNVIEIAHRILHPSSRNQRRTLRKAMLAFAAITVVALIVFGCVKLYQLTAVPPEQQQIGEIAVHRKGVTTTPAATPAHSDTPTANGSRMRQADVPPKRVKPQPTAIPSQLKSTGQKVPPLYVD